MSANNVYQNPLTSRYCSAEMSQIFSPDFKFKAWRRLWIALAKAEKQLGLNISQAQIDEMTAAADNINYKVAQAREKETRHDVMSHVFAFGEQCPNAKGIIHLGATSAFVGDNTDLLQIRAGLQLVAKRLRAVIRSLSAFALEYAHMPTLGFTHYQPAQLTTVGKRAGLWLQDLVMDYHDLQYQLKSLRFRGVKGTTGTQASFLKLFDGDHAKVNQLDDLVTQAFGFEKTYITGQTYPRRIDARVTALLAGVAQSASKFAHDMRLLANLKELEEPFAGKQIGSSAMAYKRNPMRAERMSALTRYIITNAQSPAFTAATQWFERTLDDSANKRIAIPESFLAMDAVLLIYHNIVQGLVVYPKMIAKRIQAELPFMMTENILMEAVKQGGDRQELHERIRIHAIEAGKVIKLEGGENDLLQRIADDEAFALDAAALAGLADPVLYTGRAGAQVVDFVEHEVKPLLADHGDEQQQAAALKV